MEDDSKETVSSTQEDQGTYEFTVCAYESTDCDSMHKTFTVQARQIPVRGKGSGYKVPPLTKKLLAIDACWEREKQFSPMQIYVLLQLKLNIVLDTVDETLDLL